MITMCSSNGCSSSTKSLNCPHNNGDSMLTQNSSTIWNIKIKYTYHSYKDQNMHDFTHSLALISKSTFFTCHSRSKRSFQVL